MYLSIHLTRRKFVTRAFTTQTRVRARISISRSWPAITGPVGGTARRPGLLTLQLYSLFGRRQATTIEWHGNQTFPFVYFINLNFLGYALRMTFTVLLWWSESSCETCFYQTTSKANVYIRFRKQLFASNVKYNAGTIFGTCNEMYYFDFYLRYGRIAILKQLHSYPISYEYDLIELI